MIRGKGNPQNLHHFLTSICIAESVEALEIKRDILMSVYIKVHETWYGSAAIAN